MGTPTALGEDGEGRAPPGEQTSGEGRELPLRPVLRLGAAQERGRGGESEAEGVAEPFVGPGLGDAAAGFDLVDDGPAHAAAAGGLGLRPAEQFAAPPDLGRHARRGDAEEFSGGLRAGERRGVRIRHRREWYLRFPGCRGK